MEGGSGLCNAKGQRRMARRVAAAQGLSATKDAAWQIKNEMQSTNQSRPAMLARYPTAHPADTAPAHLPPSIHCMKGFMYVRQRLQRMMGPPVGLATATGPASSARGCTTAP